MVFILSLGDRVWLWGGTHGSHDPDSPALPISLSNWRPSLKPPGPPVVCPSCSLHHNLTIFFTFSKPEVGHICFICFLSSSSSSSSWPPDLPKFLFSASYSAFCDAFGCARLFVFNFFLFFQNHPGCSEPGWSVQIRLIQADTESEQTDPNLSNLVRDLSKVVALLYLKSHVADGQDNLVSIECVL